MRGKGRLGSAPGGSAGARSAFDLPDEFTQRLRADADLLRSELKNVLRVEYPIRPPTGIPDEITRLAQTSDAWLRNPDAFVDWVIELKGKMGTKMMEKIAHLEATGNRAGADRLREMMPLGEIDHGVYVATLIDEAQALGWRAPRAMPNLTKKTGSPFYEPREFFKKMEEGDLIWDMGMWDRNLPLKRVENNPHGRDPHVLQLLYVGSKPGKDEGRKLVRWIGQHGAKGRGYAQALWDDLFDAGAEYTLRMPEILRPAVATVLGAQ